MGERMKDFVCQWEQLFDVEGCSNPAVNFRSFSAHSNIGKGNIFLEKMKIQYEKCLKWKILKHTKNIKNVN